MFASLISHAEAPTNAERSVIVTTTSDRQTTARTIAKLSAEQIRRLSREELVRVVRSSRIPVRSGRLEYLDRPTLERLAHLAKLSCRHRQ